LEGRDEKKKISKISKGRRLLVQDLKRGEKNKSKGTPSSAAASRREYHVLQPER